MMSIEDTADLEPAIASMLSDSMRYREKPAYAIASLNEVEEKLSRFLQAKCGDSVEISHLKRLGGGASKEQFVFHLSDDSLGQQRCVLRMDPLESAVATCRQREQDILKIMQQVLPVPTVLWSDIDGSQLGRPSIITTFIEGVTKPSVSSSNVSGFGTVFDKPTRLSLYDTFLTHLLNMHKVDWKKAPASFQAPLADPFQAARWQVNWWTKVWREDVSEGFPLMGLAERWMRDHLPQCNPEDLSYVHSDYRTGNFLYDESSLAITAILDWELIHIGDFHEDLAWMGISSWSSVEDGESLASGLVPMAQICDDYCSGTGRVVNPKTLYFYQVLGLYKCVVICLATSVNAASRAHNHQDALLTWLAAAGHAFLSDLAELLERGEP